MRNYLNIRYVLLLIIMIYESPLHAQFLRKDLVYLTQRAGVVIVPGKGVVLISSKDTLPSDLRPEGLPSDKVSALFLRYTKIEAKGNFTHVILPNEKTYQIRPGSVTSISMQGLKLSYNHSSDVLFITDERETSSPGLVILHGDQVMGNTTGLRWASLLDVAQGLPDGFRYKVENHELFRASTIVEDPIIGDVFTVDSPCQMQGRLVFTAVSIEEFTKSGTITSEMQDALRKLRTGQIVNSFESVTVLSTNPTSVVVVNKNGDLLVAEPVSTKLETIPLCAFYAVTH